MLIRAVLIVLLLLASSISVAKPSIELKEAVRLAEAYIAEHHISNNDRYLASVTWHEDLEQPNESCWSVFWAPNEAALLDAQLVVWVCHDGRIRHQDSWA
jgi:hypothetical protein